MENLSYVLARVKAGDRVVFGRDDFGARWVELWRGKLFERRSRVECSPAEIVNIKRALLDRPQ